MDDKRHAAAAFLPPPPHMAQQPIAISRRRKLYLKKQNAHKRQTSMTPAGFKPAIPATPLPPGLTPGHFTPGEKSGTLSRPQGRSGRVHEISHSKNFEPRTFQHVTSLIKVIRARTICLWPHLIQALLWNKIRISWQDLMEISDPKSKDIWPDFTRA